MVAQVGITTRPELIFALVGPAGVRLDDVARELNDDLRTFNYQTEHIRLSDLLENVVGWTKESDRFEQTRITHRQKMGRMFRTNLKDGAALARAGIAAIRQKRAGYSGHPDSPAQGRAYVLQQLKHPEEVNLLRSVYGSSFLLIAGHAPKEVRVRGLSERLAQKADKPGQGTHYRRFAEEIIDIDENENEDLGQNTRDTYPLADLFVDLGAPTGQPGVSRFVDLLFGHPFRTPSPEEFAMYQASAVSLRSSDHSRQVGAVIVRISRDPTGKVSNADIIASGMNEVPRRGGGFYWDGDSPDARDQHLIRYHNDDRSTKIKISALAELIEKLNDRKWLKDSIEQNSSSDLARDLLPHLKRTQFMDIGEFGRPVHAEMAALIDSARRGVAVNEHTMFVTTFPCHNCAKHIVAAGLQRVVYLEPYTKSRADFLHGEEISLDPSGKEEGGRVVFAPFTGIAPRQYRRLFAMTARGGARGLTLQQWEAARPTLPPYHLVRNAAHAYVVAEREELERLPLDTYKWDKQSVCPA